MGRSAPLWLAAWLSMPGCSGRAGPATESTPGGPRARASAAEDAPAAPAGTDEGDSDPAPAPAPRLAESGLGMGEHFEAFQIVDGEGGDAFCQVCEFATSPKIMAIGRLDDPEFHEDIKDIDAIVAKWGADEVKAFAVIGIPRDGKLATPIEGREQLLARVHELRAELDVSMPIVIPADEDGGPNTVWEQHYNPTRSRTLMFADGGNEVKYAAIAPLHLGPLDEAIRQALGS